MKSLGFVIAFVFFIAIVLVVCMSSSQQDQRLRGSEGWSNESPYGRMFNLNAMEIIRGEVLLVEKIAPIVGMSYGIHLIVKTEKEEIPVHLGPSWFIENQDIKIEKKDQVEINGSRIIFQGKPTIIAAEVEKGGDVLILRNKNGIPVWSGWRRRRR